MRKFVESPAGELRAGDTIIDPNSGILCDVERVELSGAMVALHMRGSVALNYMGLSWPTDRVLRRFMRRDEEGLMLQDQSIVERYTGEPLCTDPDPRTQCACGMKTRDECAALCLKG